MADPLNFPPDAELRWYGTPTPASPVRATIGLMHPGSMGAAVGASCVAAGAEVLWVGEGRSDATTARAEAAGFVDAGWLNSLVNRSELIVSICPPEAAADVADEVVMLGYRRLYLDANAISPELTRRIADRVENAGGDYVDGAIVGLPPTEPGKTRLYLSGEQAPRVAQMMAGGPLGVVVLDGPVGAASALKMAYGAWTKGTQALLVAVQALAMSEGVHGALLAEWEQSQPRLARQSEGLGTAAAKAWRWVSEMEEVAATFKAAGLPSGVPEAAAEVFRALTPFKDDPNAPGGAALARVLLDAARAREV